MQPECEIWLDNQLSSALAKLMQAEWKVVVKSAYTLKHKDLEDKEIFMRAKQKGNVIIITKDAGFHSFVTQYGCPSQNYEIKHGKFTYQVTLE